MEDSFQESLASLYGVASEPPPEEEAPGPGDQPGDQPGDDPGPAGNRLTQIVEEAGRLYDRAQEALAAGDFETYGRLIERLGDLLAEAERLSQ